MRCLRLSVVLAALGVAFPASAAAWDTIGPVEATYTYSSPGEVKIADPHEYPLTLPSSLDEPRDPRYNAAKYCFSKQVKVEAQVRRKPAISYTGGPDCLNAFWGGTKLERDDPCYLEPCFRTVEIPPDPEAVKLYGGSRFGIGASSSDGEAKGYGIQIFGCEASEGDYWAGACLGLTTKRRTPAKTVDWRIYYGGQLIGAETVRLSNRFIPARKGKGEYIWQGTDGFWNVCIRGNRDVYSRNGRLYCYVQTRAPRKAKWEPVADRVSGPNPGKLGP